MSIAQEKSPKKISGAPYPLTDEEKEFIDNNREGRTATELSKMMCRSYRIVDQYFNPDKYAKPDHFNVYEKGEGGWLI